VTGERFDGPAHVLAHAPLGEPPLYVTANTAVPMGPDMAHTAERAVDPLTLLLYPAEGAGDSVLYEDAGDGFGYENGEYARRAVSCEELAGSITVRLGEREGSFVPRREAVHLELRAFGSAPESVEVDGESVEPRYHEESGTLIVRLTETDGAPTVVIVR
jgi:alpha-glucosidase